MRFVLSLFLLLPCLLGAELSLSCPVEARAAQSKSIISLPFTILSSQEAAVELNLELPQGWTLISPLGVRELKAAEPAKVLLSIAVPASATAGEHTVRLNARAGQLQAQASCLVQVGARQALHTQLITYDPLVWSGSDSDLLIVLRNNGNAPYNDTLRAESVSAHWRVSPHQQVVELAPQTQQVYRVTVHAPELIERETTGSLRFFIGEQKLRASLTAIPAALPTQTSYPILPSRVSLKAFDVGERGFPKTRLEMHSHGQLSENRTISLDYRGTYFDNDGNWDISNQYYHLLLQHRSGWEIIGGHTEARFALLPRDLDGEGIRLYLDRPDYGGLFFYGRRNARSRDSVRESQLGASGLWRFAKRSRIEATYQRFNDMPSGETDLMDRQLGSLLARWQIAPWIYIVGEGAVSQKDAPIDREDDYAWLAEANLEAPLLSAHCRVHHSGTDFPGRIEDQEGYRIFLNSAWTFPVSAWFKHRYLRDNVNRVADLATVHRRQYALGGYYRAPPAWPSLGLTLDWTKLSSNSQSAPDHENKQSIIATYHQGIGRYHLAGRSKLEWVQNSLTGDKGLTHDSYADVATQWKKIDLSTRVRWQRSSVRTRNPRLHSFRGTIQYPLGPGFAVAKTKFAWQKSFDGPSTYTRQAELGYFAHFAKYGGDLRYQHKLVIGDPSEGNGHDQRHIIRGFLHYRPATSHLLELHTDLDFPGRDRNDYRVILTYTVLFGVPLPFLPSASSLSGTVYSDDEVYPKTRVLLGDRVAYTNDAGRYRFANVKPGKYQLNIDTRRIPSRWSPGEDVPVDIELERGEDHEQDIKLHATQAPNAPKAQEEPPKERALEVKQFSPVSL